MAEPAPEPARLDPRVVHTRQRVYAATVDLIAEGGVGAATVERIAERSGVARSTVYRRWPVLAELHYEAFAGLVRRAPQSIVGDTETELLRYLDDYAGRLSDPRYCSVLLSLLEASWRDASLAELRRHVFEERSSRAVSIIEAGRRSGRLRDDVPLQQVLDAVVAPFLYRRLVEQQDVTADDVRALHADVMQRFGTP